MARARRVLVVIAVCYTLISLAGDAVSLIGPKEEKPLSSEALLAIDQANNRLFIYWTCGAATLLLSRWVRGPQEFLADCLAIGGVFLMILGASGGIFTRASVGYRLTAGAANLGILAYLATRLGRGMAASNRPPSQSPAA